MFQDTILFTECLKRYHLLQEEANLVKINTFIKPQNLIGEFKPNQNKFIGWQ